MQPLKYHRIMLKLSGEALGKTTGSALTRRTPRISPGA